ncbi:Autophagy related 4J [Monocercomonoides exilis]|uniref:Autophagy related 4J n=1 Tax=Monocercomonoides exilis TaxID=2049356 RepID=UPI003559C346|nr:Autophagy related 4J [Monocercomonoides exilis]|eukprot:MONOS_7336.1-p1 / transcript=MONOS_7336.1 / gene=MONOS_7336 / organism=Monocercomonoides_exilis_PA203 / gene_product=unspecified product / transcript_product=unspecified product / location=Mono_scaffold00248:58788-59156(+) / protein_length=84 / sequence_SO=supercontig / SO=protein_coding / is_pseudo=false
MTSDTSSTYSKFRKTFKENALISADESRISLLSEAEALNKLSERLSKDYERIASGCVIPAAPLNPEDEQPDILTNSVCLKFKI